jgi:hypothetical protein
LDGTIPITAAITFVEHATDLALAAAYVAINRRSYFATRKPAQATAYLDQVRVNQTERDSFRADHPLSCHGTTEADRHGGPVPA